MIRRLVTAGSRHAFNFLYRRFDHDSRDNEAVFLSRQTNEPSFDFVELAREFESRGWKATMHLKKVAGKNMVSYAFHVLKELKLLGRCKVAILDRYDPVICLLDFPDVDTLSGSSEAHGATNTSFPKKPIVMQLWHAFGSYKKFGYQSVGTLEGHSADFTKTFNIHRNYSWVVCSGKAARKAFSEAFSCPMQRVIALDRPEYDELAKTRSEREQMIRQPQAATGASSRKTRVLMAPTLRKSMESQHPFRDLYSTRNSFEAKLDADVSWSFHPLESGLPAPGNVSAQLVDCDIAVTDYSSIVYEAYLLGKPLLFFIPDIESYVKSPGLNIDPSKHCPDLCAKTEDELVELLDGFISKTREYPYEQLERFCASFFDIDVDRTPGSTAASRLVDFAIAQTNRV